MIYVLYAIHVVVSLFLILVVLLQQGKGADLSVFGGGTTQAAFGARGAATLLHKMTVGGFIAFIFTTIGIGFLQGGGTRSSVMSTAAEEAVVMEEAIAEETDPATASEPDAPAVESSTESAPGEVAEPAAAEESEPDS